MPCDRQGISNLSSCCPFLFLIFLYKGQKQRPIFGQKSRPPDVIADCRLSHLAASIFVLKLDAVFGLCMEKIQKKNKASAISPRTAAFNDRPNDSPKRPLKLSE